MLLHEKKWLVLKNIIKKPPMYNAMAAYVLLTYFLAVKKSFVEMATASLFRSPLPRPISSIPIQPISDVNVMRIP